MRAFERYATAAMLTGATTVEGAGPAMAGADDGGTHAFFAIPSPDRSPAATNAAANAQSQASVSRTGVTQECAPRPHVAVTRLAHGAPPDRSAPHVSVVRQEGVHRAATAAPGTIPRAPLHAMRREGGIGRRPS